MAEPTQREAETIKQIVHLMYLLDDYANKGGSLELDKRLGQRMEYLDRRLRECSLYNQNRYMRNWGIVFNKLGRKFSWEIGFKGMPFFRIGRK